MTGKRAHRVGPFSRASALARIDHRTSQGRLARHLERELSDYVGDPTPPQQLLIRMVTVLAVRLSMITERALAEREPSELTDRYLCSYSSQLRQALQALGLERPDAQVPALSSYLVHKSAGG